jgi:hypothetical protein
VKRRVGLRGWPDFGRQGERARLHAFFGGANARAGAGPRRTRAIAWGRASAAPPPFSALARPRRELDRELCDFRTSKAMLSAGAIAEVSSAANGRDVDARFCSAPQHMTVPTPGAGQLSRLAAQSAISSAYSRPAHRIRSLCPTPLNTRVRFGALVASNNAWPWSGTVWSRSPCSTSRGAHSLPIRRRLGYASGIRARGRNGYQARATSRTACERRLEDQPPPVSPPLLLPSRCEHAAARIPRYRFPGKQASSVQTAPPRLAERHSAAPLTARVLPFRTSSLGGVESLFLGVCSVDERHGADHEPVLLLRVAGEEIDHVVDAATRPRAAACPAAPSSRACSQPSAPGNRAARSPTRARGQWRPRYLSCWGACWAAAAAKCSSGSDCGARSCSQRRVSDVGRTRGR